MLILSVELSVEFFDGFIPVFLRSDVQVLMLNAGIVSFSGGILKSFCRHHRVISVEIDVAVSGVRNGLICPLF